MTGFPALSVTPERASIIVMDQQDARERLDVLRAEHRDLDAQVAMLMAAADDDQLQIARLKKRKLRLKDEIARAESFLIPDIIA